MTDPALETTQQAAALVQRYRWASHALWIAIGLLVLGALIKRMAPALWGWLSVPFAIAICVLALAGIVSHSAFILGRVSCPRCSAPFGWQRLSYVAARCRACGFDVRQRSRPTPAS